MALIDLTPKRVDFKVKSGDTLKADFSFTNADDDTPVDLTGIAATIEIRKKLGSDVIKTLSIGSGLTITGDDDNVLSLSTAINFTGKYKYELEVVWLGGRVQTPFGGYINSIGEITE